jgi:hypothetical protein
MASECEFCLPTQSMTAECVLRAEKKRQFGPRKTKASISQSLFLFPSQESESLQATSETDSADTIDVTWGKDAEPSQRTHRQAVSFLRVVIGEPGKAKQADLQADRQTDRRRRNKHTMQYDDTTQ